MSLQKISKKTCLTLAIAQTLSIPTAQAATIIVNTTGDTDGNDQACTLREAIVSIHDSSPASKGCTYTGLFGVNDTINFHSGLNDQVIKLNQSAALSITKDLTINGLGEKRLTIDGKLNGDSRVFSVNNATVGINGLTISGGRDGGISAEHTSSISLSNSTVSGNSGGFYGGGIFALSSSISLSNSTVSGNSAVSYGGGFTASYSSISLSNSTVSGNSAVSSYGGGISALYSSISLSNSIVSGNSAGSNGGGVSAKESSISLSNSTMSGNSAGISGGGLSASDSSKITLTNSTVSGNSAMEFGGGVASLVSRVHLTDSTVSGNSANKLGGGILFGGNDFNDFMTLNHSTVVNNTSGDDGGGISVIGTVVARFTNSIVSGNTSVDLADEIGGLGSTFIVDRHNLFGDNSKSNSQAFYGFSPDSSGSDITATSDGIMPTTLASILEPTLKKNGGPTKTHALVVDSPAINAGNPSLCTASDQRGEPRSDGKCDIGSYEFVDSSCYVINAPADKTVVFCM